MVLAVLHDINLAMGWADRIMVLDQGRVVRAGSPVEVVDSALLHEVYRVQAVVETVNGRRLVAVRHALGGCGAGAVMSTSLERWMVSRSRAQLAATVACGLLAQAMLVIHALCLARLLAQAMAGASLHPWLAIGLAALVLRGVLVWLEEWWAQQVGMRTRVVLRERLLARLMRLGPAWAAARPTGELQATLVAAVDAVQVHASRHVPSLLGAVLGCALALGALAWVDAGCALLLAVFVLGQPLLDRLWLRRHMPGASGVMAALAAFGAQLLDSLRGMETLWPFGASARWRMRLAEQAARLRAESMHTLRAHLAAHRPDAFRWPGRHGQCPGVGQLATGPGPAGCGIAAGRAAAVA